METRPVTIDDLQARLRSGETTARTEAENVLARIEERNPEINAFLSVTADLARAQADACDERIRSGEPFRPLEGVPLAVKDNMVVEGVRTTCGSRILENYRPPYTATAVRRRLRRVGWTSRYRWLPHTMCPS